MQVDALHRRAAAVCGDVVGGCRRPSPYGSSAARVVAILKGIR